MSIFTVSTPHDSTVLMSAERLRILSLATRDLCFSSESANCVSTLESVCGKYGSLSTKCHTGSVDDDREIEHVSFTFDTIKLDSLIVCGLLALPHDLVPNQTQDDVCCACIAGVSSLSTSNSAAWSMCGLPASPRDPVHESGARYNIACASLMPQSDAWLLMFNTIEVHRLHDCP